MNIRVWLKIGMAAVLGSAGCGAGNDLSMASGPSGTVSSSSGAGGAGGGVTPTGSPLFSDTLNDGTTSLRGFVDMHTHPMSHLGFGGHVMHGAPDVGITMPVGHIYRDNDCNHDPEPAGSEAEAMGSCYAAHGGYDLIKNKCGNIIRSIVLDEIETSNGANHPHDVEHPEGYPSFSDFPKHNDILHQQMWVDWIERARDGGMRVMVALATNNYTLATGIEASAGNPRRDKASGDLQIGELKQMVNSLNDGTSTKRHSWMEIAYSAADLRRIVGEDDKLAVILGVELDDIGDFVVNRISPSPKTVRDEIQRLYDEGVRYVFPVHIIDNLFGGTAVYEDNFDRANCFHAGQWWDLRCTDGSGPDELGIKHQVNLTLDVPTWLKLGQCGGAAPVPSCANDEGHMNSRGLTPLGREAIDQMMRLGMIIDIDHASLATVRDILDHTNSTPGGKYPLVSGHNSLRGPGDNENNENKRTEAQYKELAQRHGIAGIGWGALDAQQWLRDLDDAHKTGIPLALGSDINGLVVQPAPRPSCEFSPCVDYSTSFPWPQHGSKTWDYNQDGVAHVGLFPDILRDVEGLDSGNGRQIVDTLFDGAEAFAVMWETAESAGHSIPAPPTAPAGITVTSALYGQNCGIPLPAADFTEWVSDTCAGESSCTYQFTWAPWGGDPNPSLCEKEIDIRYTCGTQNHQVTVIHKQTPQDVSLPCP